MLRIVKNRNKDNKPEDEIRNNFNYLEEKSHFQNFKMKQLHTFPVQKNIKNQIFYRKYEYYQLFQLQKQYLDYVISNITLHKKLFKIVQHDGVSIK